MASIDENALNRLLAAGYTYDAAVHQLNRQSKKILDDFRAKNTVLSEYFEGVSFYDFVSFVFPGCSSMLVVTGDSSDEDGGSYGSYSTMTVEELFDYQQSRANVYVPPADFIKGRYSYTTCHNLYALVLDLDDVRADTLKLIRDNGTLGGIIPMPTMIVNSGRGLHFYYVFQEPVPFYVKNRPALTALYRSLFLRAKKNIAASPDWHSLIQPFRLPGSLTKIDQVASGWISGEKYSVEKLAATLGLTGLTIDLSQRDLLPQDKYAKEKARRIALGEVSDRICPRCGRTLIKRVSGTGKGEFFGCTGFPSCRYMETLDGTVIGQRSSSLAMNGSFYSYCLERVQDECAEGNRYMSLLALSVVGYKEGIPLEQLKDDFKGLVQRFNQIGARFTEREASKALRAYNEKALKVTAATLEEWFGWSFANKSRHAQEDSERNYSRLQEDVDNNPAFKDTLLVAGVLDEDGKINRRRYSLWRARRMRDSNQADRGTVWTAKNGHGSVKERIEEYLEKHPGEDNRSKIARELGISRKTVIKWLPIIAEERIKAKELLVTSEALKYGDSGKPLHIQSAKEDIYAIGFPTGTGLNYYYSKNKDELYQKIVEYEKQGIPVIKMSQAEYEMFRRVDLYNKKLNEHGKKKDEE